MSRARDIADGTLDSADINGGTIDDTAIGGTTPAAGKFSTLTSTGDTAIENSSPSLKLKDSNAASPTALGAVIRFIDNTDTEAGYIGYGSTSDADFRIINSALGGIKFSTNDIERAQIDSSGNVRADNFTNLDGDGAPNFPNGLDSSNLVGMIAPFAMSTAPSGWLVCNGGEYAIANYDDLYTAIGTTWGSLTDGNGGAGSTHFVVPDLRGAFLRGSGSHGTETMADTNAFAGPSVGSFENDQLQNITGSVSTMSTDGTSAGVYNPTSDSGAFSVSPATGNGFTTAYSSSPSKGNTLGFDASNSTNARAGDETRPFNAGILYCIKH